MTDFVWTYTAPGSGALTFGAGQDLQVESVDGLDGYEQVRSGSTPIPRGHGNAPGPQWAGPRLVVFDLATFQTSQSALDDVRQGCVDVTVPQPSRQGTLEWSRPGHPSRLVYCRPVWVDWPSSGRDGGRNAYPTLAFQADDPRIYASSTSQATLRPYAATGGVDGPIDGAKDATGVGGNDVVACNEGNFDAPAVLRIYGPTSGTCSDVQIINRTSGVTVDVQTDIGVGQILTVDVHAYTTASGGRVVDLSGASRYGSWQPPRTPWMLVPGTNVIRMTASGSTGGMAATVSWRHTWAG